MSCTLATLAACFSLSGFYVDGAMLVTNHGEGRWMHVEPSTIDVRRDTFAWNGHDYARWDNNAQNPYARVSLGYSIEFKHADVYVELVGHESSIATGRDRGSEWAALGVRWHPFGSR